MRTAFTGTWSLIVLALKRDRVQLPVWILAISALMAIFGYLYDDLLPTQADLTASTQVFGANPIARMFGLASGDDLGSYTLLRSFTFVTVLASLMSVLAVVRHTRQSEESRQAEMLGSAVVGRYAMLAAALVVVALANAAVAVGVGAAFMLNGLPAAGSFAAGAAVGSVGLSFGGVAAVTAQVSPSSRGASGMAAGAIGVGFLLVAVGGVLGSVRETGVFVDPAWPTWLSPIGWGQLVRPFGGASWWYLLPSVGFFAALSAVSFALIDRRDVGRGLIAEGRGPARAAPTLLHPLGLVWRLQQGVFLGWAAAMVVFGLVMGAISDSIEEMLEELEASEIFERVGGTDQLVDAYFVGVLGFLAAIVSAYAVQVLLRMRIEEAEGPLESVLGAAIGRPRWMLSYAVNAVAGTFVLLLLLGVSTGIGAGIAFDDMRTWLPELTLAAVVQAPAAFVVAGVVVVAFAFLPRRAAGVSWAVFAAVLIAGPMFGEMLNLPDLVMDLSPFTHVPRLPAASFDVLPLAILTAIAAALGAAGFAQFRRRDLVLH
jgi:ABC-2 type transport system permease protein